MDPIRLSAVSEFAACVEFETGETISFYRPSSRSSGVVTRVKVKCG